MAAECYPSQTAGRCMRRWQVATLAAFTLLLTIAWLPVRAAAWAITAARTRGA